MIPPGHLIIGNCPLRQAAFDRKLLKQLAAIMRMLVPPVGKGAGAPQLEDDELKGISALLKVRSVGFLGFNSLALHWIAAQKGFKLGRSGVDSPYR